MNTEGYDPNLSRALSEVPSRGMSSMSTMSGSSRPRSSRAASSATLRRDGCAVQITAGQTLVASQICPAHKRKQKQSDPGSFQWKAGEMIGSGGYGTVFQAHDQRTGNLMAVKLIKFDPTANDVQQKIWLLQNEIKMLQTLKHPSIVRYITTERSGTSINILMEYVPGGSIAQVLARFGPFEEPVAASYLLRIVSGVEYLHAHKVVHRDLKGANILITPSGQAKLADFGSSGFVADLTPDTPQGTLHFMAPEILCGDACGTPCDIWSLGCLVQEMMTAKAPWAHILGERCPPGQVVKFVTKASESIWFPEEWSEEARDLVTKCCTRDPTLRPTASQVLEHPWLQQAKSSAAQTDVQRIAAWVANWKADPGSKGRGLPDELATLMATLKSSGVSSP
eukprot:NODE_604_length_1928_cov_6.856307_g483_i0.p1 GENE.NODE_604_length_1928_cov_6.856307_g483_i0~~NODE_604_length_1928_cov_6.856307_g483_i0.p1  ORF type:complete len:395 (+),score=64.40 NODE_604_length_1928_cov_6.856307_g483_i0:711-1895(+)